MKLDKQTGLYFGNGTYVRVHLVRKNWEIMEVPRQNIKDYLTKPHGTFRVLFRAPADTYLSAQAAIDAWLKTNPFR